MRLACLHTTPTNVAVFDAAARALGRDPAALRHHVRADLLADAERDGGLTPAIERGTVDALRELAADADAVLLTCSTLGPAADAAALLGATAVPVLRVDAALATAAVADGGTVVVLCAVATTVEPTRALFERAARTSGADIVVRLVPDAWSAFRAGDQDRYLDLIAAASDGAIRDGATCVALAQASMAGAAPRCRSAPPLTSPVAGLRAAWPDARP